MKSEMKIHIITCQNSSLSIAIGVQRNFSCVTIFVPIYNGKSDIIQIGLAVGPSHAYSLSEKHYILIACRFLR